MRRLFIFLVILVVSGCGTTQKVQHRDVSFDEGIQQIKHLVVIYMENHSFDNLYGEFKGANGIENAKKGNFVQVDEEGNPYQYLPEIPRNNSFPTNLPNALFNIDQYVPSDKKTPDVTHRFFHNQQQINGGKMDKFAAYNDSKGLAMGYYSTEKLPLYPIAKKYTLCDNFFQSVYGGSYFNHVFLIAAAAPVWPDAPASMVAKLDADGNLIKDGVVTPDGYVVNHVLSRNKPYPAKSDTSKLLPSQTMPTIGDRLSEKNISWAWYSEGWDDAVAGRKTNFAYNHEPFLYFKQYEEGTEGRKHLKDQNDFIKAAKEGTLPSVSFVKPGGGNDEHPGGSAVYPSEQLAVNLINAVLEGPNAKDALVILTYDEFGGFFDHVVPPVIDRWGPGSRIPAIIIGPFAKKGHVDHTQYETVSILSFIEHRWGIKPLAERDKNADPFRNALAFN
ncbi:alkaline phosphatase family protein [Parapedobacter indicus]|uniref:Phospholipase C n=1 Tax=Parapedobacter indicus TaxID=1477437 RepID=A0A1I3QSU0_9SPHI|nr:alkaline phosphatase family protein [Parapedobacter indicus]PPL00231.1 phospholipase C [Parapedobacter indicus]SFJ37148.1 phospholipase C [Parapedobacter indicus]